MSIFDCEEIDDIFDDGFIATEVNPYLENQEKALDLISKIIPIVKFSYDKQKTMTEMDYLLDVNFLGSLRNIPIKDKAKLQVSLFQLSDRLLETKKYRILQDKSVIGIGGKFSAGKSKFINSILKAGEEMLPEDQNPTTSIPTYIIHSTGEKINAYTVDNNEVTLDVDAMQALTHKFFKKYNIGFSSFIDSLIIMEPDLPYTNLVFLDTPGYSKADVSVASKSQKNISDENKAYEQLKKVDFLIWLVDIENGELNESDITFIKKLNIENPVLIVINKSDKKDDSEIEQIIQHIRVTAEQNAINCYDVVGYSSRRGKEWNDGDIIGTFLRKAQSQKRKKDDLLFQLSSIDRKIRYEIENIVKDKVSERNKLKDLITSSEDIMDIKTIVEIYGDTLDELSEINNSNRLYIRTKEELDTLLESHYKR